MELVVREAVRTRLADALLHTLDLTGTFVFGMEGALAAVAGHLDFFGAMVLSFCTAVGGGIIRDLLIGAAPPESIRDWRYGTLALAGGCTSVFLYHSVRQLPPLLLLTLDAGGLSLFAVAGATKALKYNINPFIAVLMGTITGVGGGTVRDILLARVPTVLRADVYATAALLGAVVFVGAINLKLSPRLAAILGGTGCFVLRMVAAIRHWNLPGVASS
jgi:uncharacterized membrane protein YeiH